MLSGEIRLPDLLKKLMILAIEYAGAERGFLILERNGLLFIEAEMNAKNEEVRVQVSEPIGNSGKLSQGIVHFVSRTRQSIVLGNASFDSDFKTDSFIGSHDIRSLLCQPLLSQGNLIGLLCFENNLLPHAFSEERLEVLQIIVSQAVISIENALLVNNLEMKVAERTTELATINEELVITNEALMQAKEIAEEGEKLFNTLLGFSELLLENLNEFDKDIIVKQVSIIHRIFSQTFKLLEDILMWANLQTGKLPFVPEKILFYETCNEIIGNLIESANTKQITITCSEKSGHLILTADVNMYKTVIRNLLSNAVKFTNPCGKIQIPI